MENLKSAFEDNVFFRFCIRFSVTDYQIIDFKASCLQRDHPQRGSSLSGLPYIQFLILHLFYRKTESSNTVDNLGLEDQFDFFERLNSHQNFIKSLLPSFSMSDLSNLTTLAKIREKLSQHDVILETLRKNHSENIETQKRQKQLLDEKDQKIRDLEKALNRAQHNNSIQARIRT